MLVMLPLYDCVQCTYIYVHSGCLKLSPMLRVQLLDATLPNPTLQPSYKRMMYCTYSSCPKCQYLCTTIARSQLLLPCYGFSKLFFYHFFVSSITQKKTDAMEICPVNTIVCLVKPQAPIDKTKSQQILVSPNDKEFRLILNGNLFIVL